MSLLVKSSNFVLHCHVLGLKFFYTLFFQKCSIAFYLSLLVSKFLMCMFTFCLLLCSLVLICFFDVFLFLKNVCSINCFFVSIFFSFLQVYLVIVNFIKYNSQIFKNFPVLQILKFFILKYPILYFFKLFFHLYYHHVCSC